MKFTAYAGSLLVAALAAASCGKPMPRPESPVIPQRIISVVPSATESLFALGLASRVIAVGDYDRVPSEFGEKPRIGGLLNPNIEKIIELKPDLVITYGSQDVLQERLRTIGIRLYPFTHGGIEQTLQFMLDLGATVGAQEKAYEIVARIRKTFDEVRAHAPPNHPKVLLVHNRSAGALGSFYSVGSHAFQHELIEIAGGRNLFGDVEKEVLQPSIEEVIARAPDIIIETMPAPLSEREATQRRSDWQTLDKVPAVVKKRVYVVGEDDLLLPGPSLDRAARHFAEIIQR
jgi:iron complex transport system substrate-binding protein